MALHTARSLCLIYRRAIPRAMVLTWSALAAISPYRNKILLAGVPLQLQHGNNRGFVMWNTDIVVPMLQDMHIEHGTGDQMPELSSRVGSCQEWCGMDVANANGDDYSTQRHSSRKR